MASAEIRKWEVQGGELQRSLTRKVGIQELQDKGKRGWASRKTVRCIEP
jgi:hypothetical protein